MPLVLLAHVPVIYVTDPSEDWCAVIDAALGGDVVMLEGGEYLQPCEILAKASDLPGEQTVVQSLDPIDPAMLRQGLEVSGDRLVLQDLVFSGAGVVAGDLVELGVRGARFEGVGLRQAGEVGELFVTDTELRDVTRGLELAAGGTFDVDNVLVVGAGEGIVAGPGAEGVVRDTVVTESHEAALRLTDASVVVERTLLEGAGDVLAIDGGDVLVRSSIVLGGVVASGADLVGNTVLGALAIEGGRFVDNALDRSGPEGDGNVACTDLDACFVDAGAWDFYPTPTSPLRTSGMAAPELVSDWCRRVRASPPTTGALEAYGALSMGPIAAGFKDQVDCTLPDAPPEEPPAATEPIAVADSAPEEDPGCGCATPAGAGESWVILVALGVWRRITGRSGRLSRLGPGRPGEECGRT